MVYFNRNIKKKKPSVLKWAVYAVVLVGVLFFFIPKYLIYKANNIFETEINKEEQFSNKPPSKKMMTAYNYLQVAKFFPAGEDDGIKGQKFIMDYYYPKFKEDYAKMKMLCIDNATSFLLKNGMSQKDSASRMALEDCWKKYPDKEAVNDFLEDWQTYQKNYQKSLEGYYRFSKQKN